MSSYRKLGALQAQDTGQQIVGCRVELQRTRAAAHHSWMIKGTSLVAIPAEVSCSILGKAPKPPSTAWSALQYNGACETTCHVNGCAAKSLQKPSLR